MLRWSHHVRQSGHTRQTVYMPEALPLFLHAIKHFEDVDYLLVTSLAQSEMKVVEEMRSARSSVNAFASKSPFILKIFTMIATRQPHTTCTAKADPFTISQLEGIDVTYFHLGALFRR